MNETHIIKIDSEKDINDFAEFMMLVLRSQGEFAMCINLEGEHE